MDYDYDLEAFNVRDLSKVKTANVESILDALKLSSVCYIHHISLLSCYIYSFIFISMSLINFFYFFNFYFT